MNPSEAKEFKELRELIEHSLGKRISDEIHQLQMSVRLLKKNKEELINWIRMMQREDVVAQIWDFDHRERFYSAMEELLRLLHNFLAAAFSLVDHMRVHRKLYVNTDFENEIQKQLSSRFAADSDHMIANGLRNIALHIKILPASGNMIWSKQQGEKVSYVLDIPKLLEWDGWNKAEKVALGKMGKSIDILEFVERYYGKVEAFYVWLWKRQAELHQAEVDEANALIKRARALFDK
jgi:hypothetical protein